MSFSKTVSIFAALTSIFVAAGTGYKLAQNNNEFSSSPVEEVSTKYEYHIAELNEKISGLEKQLTNANPPTPITLPEPSTKQPVIQSPPLPKPPPLPPITTPSPSSNGNFE